MLQIYMLLTAILSRWIAGTLMVLIWQPCIHTGKDIYQYQHCIMCSYMAQMCAV